MRVISMKPFYEAARSYPNDARALDDTYRVLQTEKFLSPQNLKARFASLDRFKYREKWWVIDVGGNNLRIISYIRFETQNVFIRHIVPHKEYDRLTEYYRRNPE
ncbi:type II toxin-antitoxin system HigB family toxin [Erwinia papayae]|uniref:Type II toxin-antitoxin system HigB family toxin n=1 Tax=Erwinia papayae TaxID=206499 RepID=A0ABV3N3Z6_9GAMM